MQRFFRFIKKETVFTVALVAALISVCFTPPSPSYLGYVDLPVLELLFCLMCAVAGLRAAGVMDWLSEALTSRVKSAKALAAVFIAVCFFSAMLITNDVALLTFVPLTLAVFGEENRRRLILVIVLETAAANLGSMATPIGNPQNLFLYSYYSMRAGDFFAAVLPMAALYLALLALLTLLFRFGKL